MPGLILSSLPSGRAVRVCEECQAEAPRHRYFCSAALHYSRVAILRELVALEDERAHRFDFWAWAVLAGVPFDAPLEQRNRLRSDLAQLRQQPTRPPWKRRRLRAGHATLHQRNET